MTPVTSGGRLTLLVIAGVMEQQHIIPGSLGILERMVSLLLVLGMFTMNGWTVQNMKVVLNFLQVKIWLTASVSPLPLFGLVMTLSKL